MCELKRRRPVVRTLHRTSLEVRGTIKGAGPKDGRSQRGGAYLCLQCLFEELLDRHQPLAPIIVRVLRTDLMNNGIVYRMTGVYHSRTRLLVSVQK